MTPGLQGTPRRWWVVSVRPPASVAADLVADELLRRGGRAVVEEGGRLVTHLPEPDDPEAEAERIARALADALGGEDFDLRTGWQEHEQWEEVWRRGLEPRRIGARIVVTPSWCEPELRPGDLPIVVDPGMAFGTAEHGTTRGCLRLLERTVRPGERIADVGAGSGILSIAAAHLGASDVLAVEGDPWAVEPARENAVANGVEGVVQVVEAWVDVESLPRLTGPRDGIVANIEGGVLRSLLSAFRASLRPDGWLILGGILDHEWPEVLREAERAGFQLRATDPDGEWRSALFGIASGGSPASAERS